MLKAQHRCSSVLKSPQCFQLVLKTLTGRVRIKEESPSYIRLAEEARLMVPACQAISTTHKIKIQRLSNLRYDIVVLILPYGNTKTFPVRDILYF